MRAFLLTPTHLVSNSQVRARQNENVTCPRADKRRLSWRRIQLSRLNWGTTTRSLNRQPCFVRTKRSEYSPTMTGPFNGSGSLLARSGAL
jgi:hypothetical protein